jgi:hypothetical protein
MNSIQFATLLMIVGAPVYASEVTASLSIGQPGFYGHIDIGDYPPPQLIYRQPMMVEPVVIDRPPIYLRVPADHAKNWRKHCNQYNACGERVYFVQNNWYQREYVPRYQERHGNRHDEHQRDDYRGNSRNGHRDDYRDSNRNEHSGKGHDK